MAYLENHGVTQLAKVVQDYENLKVAHEALKASAGQMAQSERNA